MSSQAEVTQHYLSQIDINELAPIGILRTAAIASTCFTNEEMEARFPGFHFVKKTKQVPNRSRFSTLSGKQTKGLIKKNRKTLASLRTHGVTMQFLRSTLFRVVDAGKLKDEEWVYFYIGDQLYRFSIGNHSHNATTRKYGSASSTRGRRNRRKSYDRLLAALNAVCQANGLMRVMSICGPKSFGQQSDFIFKMDYMARHHLVYCTDECYTSTWCEYCLNKLKIAEFESDAHFVRFQCCDCKARQQRLRPIHSWRDAAVRVKNMAFAKLQKDFEAAVLGK
eukprot:TRINITY_DN8256_c0_g1_i2.p1 TRINITY_DN8256_c0_g1~~TRINITY_DN8256_c0_g1_i2.p1  ORF type:complete len:289 (-),score=21.24 TRINITY_DN8256_c0_g1_i2:487-1326(-)